MSKRRSHANTTTAGPWYITHTGAVHVGLCNLDVEPRGFAICVAQNKYADALRTIAAKLNTFEITLKQNGL